MELMTGKNLKIVETCTTFARKFMELPERIEVHFEDCPSEMFETQYNAAQSEDNRLYFNKQWFLKVKENHTDDIRYFVFHELRHMHQWISINKMNNGEKTEENQKIIEKWDYEFRNYIRNEGGETQILNLKQEVEMDASAYGVALCHLFYAFNSSFKPLLSVPDEVIKDVYARAQAIVNTDPKIIQYSKLII